MVAVVTPVLFNFFLFGRVTFFKRK
jgi:hypothetical protein